MKKFETREWVFVILIIMLVQFIVQTAAWLYGGNSGALGYLSFAGTAVSIILAVLAIMYSFLQSSSQEKSSANISTQVTKLIDVVGNIEVSKEDLLNTLNVLEGVTTKLDMTIEHQGKLRNEVNDLSNLFRTNKYAPEVGDNIYEKPLENGFNGLSLTLVFIYYMAQYQLTISEAIDELMFPVLKDVEVFQDNEADIFKAFTRGAFMNTYQLLNTIGYVEIQYDSTIVLHENFQLACEKYIEKARNSESNIDDVIKNAIENCIVWNREA
ncbi:hypothetical protein GI293_001459 [Vibrio fluvialis]|nr:hypothetical protein [Vibrio fluvialis]